MKQAHSRRMPCTVPGTAKEILSYIDRHGIYDKDSAAPADAPRRIPERQSVMHGKREAVRMRLDLHGLTREEAAVMLRSALERCRGKGIGEMLVIHGRGRHSTCSAKPVLKELVKRLFESDLAPFVDRTRSGRPREGGDGVTVAYLSGPRKNRIIFMPGVKEGRKTLRDFQV